MSDKEYYIEIRNCHNCWEHLFLPISGCNTCYPKPDSKVECQECGWKGNTTECNFGHHDFYCPKCDKEALKYL